MTSYEERMAAMGDSDSDSDYLEMKKYVKPKPSAATVKKKKVGASKFASKTAVAKKKSSSSPAKRKRASTSAIKEEFDAIHAEDYGLSDLFATPSYMPGHTAAHGMQPSYIGHDHPVANTLHSQDTFVQDQSLEAAYSNPAYLYNPNFSTNLIGDFATEYFPQTNVPSASYSYSNEVGRSVYDEDCNVIDGKTQQVSSSVSPSQNESSRYEGSESEDERPRKAAKLNKGGEPRKPRRPRPKLLKWSDDDWKNVILGIVWACGETGVQIPFEQAAQVVDEHCTAGALQQALLKLRGKQIAEGYQIPSLKMAWTRKNKYSSSPSSSANPKSAQVPDAGKNAFPRKQPTRVEGTQSKIVTLNCSYSELDRQGIPFPFKWKKSSPSTELGASWTSTDRNQDDKIGRSQSLSASDIQVVPESSIGAELSATSQMPNANNHRTQAVQIQPGGHSMRARRQQHHRNGKVSFGSAELTLNPAGSVDGQTATFHDYPDADGVFVMDPLNEDTVTPGNSSTLQYSEETLELLEGRGRTDGASDLRTNFVFPERPNDPGQGSSRTPMSPRIVSTGSSAGRRQGHRRSDAIVPGSLFTAGMPNSVDNANANHTHNNVGEEKITYSDIVANTTLIHAPNTPNRLAQVYSPGYLDSASSWLQQSPATPTTPTTPSNTKAAKGHVAFALTSSTRIDGAFNPQGNHTVDLDGGMTMTRASYEILLTANDTEGLFNNFSNIADNVFD